jgi:hypothetical protein
MPSTNQPANQPPVPHVRQQNGHAQAQDESIDPWVNTSTGNGRRVSVDVNNGSKVVLFTEPHRCLHIPPRYEADEHGKLLVDEDRVTDIEALIHSGCRTRR